VKQYRTSLALLLIIAVFTLGVPSLGFGGGCDEPGYTGGSCSKAETQGNGNGGSGNLNGEEPGDAASGGGGGGQTLPSVGTESASVGGTTFTGTLAAVARSVLGWLLVSPVR